MGLGPVELNGVISRTQDYSVIKQNEDNKGIVNQQAFQNTFEKELDIRHTQVVQKDDIRIVGGRFHEGTSSVWGDNVFVIMSL